MVSLFNRIMEIPSSVIWVYSFHVLSFLTGEILYALIGFEMVFDPERFAVFVVPLEAVASVSVHVTERLGGSPVREQNRYLMKRFWSQRQKISEHICIFEIGLRITFLSVNKIRKLQGVTDNARAHR